jgi:hypothetical protein
MRKVFSIFAIAIIIATLCAAFLATTAFALTYNQPTTFTIGDSYAYQSVLEQGDQFFIAKFYLNYATPANAPASVGEAYLGSVKYLTTSIGTVQPYSFFNTSGTAEWFYAVYLTADQVTAYNTFFGTTMWSNSGNYSMQMVGNPTLTWVTGSPPLPQSTSSFSANSFNTNVDVATTRSTITEPLIRVMATYYEQRWGTAYDLVQEIGGILKLTTSGEQYFGQSITSLRIMAPGVFADSLSKADMADEKLINDYYIDLTDTDVPIYGANWVSQTFTAGDNYSISGIDARIYKVGTPGTVTVHLRTIAAGVPSGPDLVTGTINGNLLSTYDRGEWQKLIFTTAVAPVTTINYALTPGTQYAIIVSAATGDVNNYVVWRDDSTGSYTGGQRCSSVNSGVAWAANAGEDFIFAILSIEGASGAYQAKLSSHLDETEFGLPSGGINNMAASWGLSRNWFTSLLWLMISFGIGIVASLAIKNNRPLFPIILVMLPIGNYTGFLLLNITIIVGLICALALVYVFAFSKSI